VFVALRVRCIPYSTILYHTLQDCNALHPFVRSFVRRGDGTVSCRLFVACCKTLYRTVPYAMPNTNTKTNTSTQRNARSTVHRMRCQKNIGTIHCYSFLYPGASSSDSVVSNGMAWYLLRVESSRWVATPIASSVSSQPFVLALLPVVRTLRAASPRPCLRYQASWLARHRITSHRIASHPSPYGMCYVFQLRRWSSFFWRSSFHLGRGRSIDRIPIAIAIPIPRRPSRR